MQFQSLRRIWLWGTAALTLGAFTAAILLAPAGGSAPGPALESLLFLGTSVHVASTAWFYTVPEIRRHAGAHRARYVYAPVALIAAGAVAGAGLPPETVRWASLGFYGWQFWHFQKQNLGLAALAAAATGTARLSRRERAAIVAAGVFGIVALVAHPELLQVAVDSRLRWLFPAAALGYALAVTFGIVLWARRVRRCTWSALAYVGSVLFFAPVFLFRSPYAAVAGLTIAHGLQYVLIMSLIAGSTAAPQVRWLDSAAQSSGLRLLLFTNLAVVLGAILTSASHLHDGSAPGRALYGAFLGAVMAHFVIDAGLWRLRDEFPRRFLSSRLPYLLGGAGRASA
ncbi:hypothetical protein [Catenulispora pinisilvae]|uniref:hypothetical protein n=1 Tax=Catenulispora pinisilvae TaxID=2705253 RepID=UPI001892327A|nr:hypothetical protein [Catenulispora pinisilvae]